MTNLPLQVLLDAHLTGGLRPHLLENEATWDLVERGKTGREATLSIRGLRA
jgi:hypothetical protein